MLRPKSLPLLLLMGTTAFGTPAAADRLLESAVKMGDSRWDAQASLLLSAGEGKAAGKIHNVRQTTWYSLGLMALDRPGDRERALEGVRAVLRQQLEQPGAPWRGTFARSPEEPLPRPGARMWRDYDPNWREFVGTAFALLLERYGDRFPPADRQAMENAIGRAVEGELEQKRLAPAYTNIALMHGFLLGFAGERLQRPDWIRGAEQWIRSIDAGFDAHRTFDEFNSPTYTGVDLYAVELLRRYGATGALREAGGRWEAALWDQISEFYHPDLGNLAGPYDRAYGMDMRSYVALTGLWISAAMPGIVPPHPPVSDSMEHGSDFLFLPCIALLPPDIPAPDRARMAQFKTERFLSDPIGDGTRVATAWLGKGIMIGAEATGLSREVLGPHSQFHPVTIHWQLPSGAIGWISLIQSPRLDARAGRDSLDISAKGDCTFRIHAPGAGLADIGRDRWTLPSLSVEIRSDAAKFSQRAQAGDIDVTYRGVSGLALRTRWRAATEYDLLRLLPPGLLDEAAANGAPDSSGLVGNNRHGNRWYEAGKQRSGCWYLIAAAVANDPARAERAWTSIAVTFAHQEPDGGFSSAPKPTRERPATFDERVETSYFYLQELAHALLVVQESPLASRFHGRIEALKPQIRRACDFIQSGYGAIIKDSTRAANRILIAAKAFGLCGVLLDDSPLEATSRRLVGVALGLRDAQGVFIEEGGRDSSYNAVSLLMAQALDLHLPDAALEAAVVKAMQWERTRILPDGRILAEGNTRTGLGQEKSFNGGIKAINGRETALALCYYGLIHDDPDAIALAARVLPLGRQKGR